MSRPDDIAAYVYRADILTIENVAEALAKNGFPVCPGEVKNAEAVEPMLDELAQIKGIDRDDEWTFDSDDFPKVMFRDQYENYIRTLA